MSDSKERVTIQPSFPRSLVSDLEIALLGECGFSCEDDNGGTLYFCTTEYTSDIFDCKLNRELVMKDKGPTGRYLRKVLARKLARKTRNVSIPDSVLSWEAIFQNILLKQTDLNGRKAIKEIVAEGAFYSTKANPGEQGGFVTVITPDDVRSGSTKSLLNDLRQAPLRARMLRSAITAMKALGSAAGRKGMYAQEKKVLEDLRRSLAG